MSKPKRSPWDDVVFSADPEVPAGPPATVDPPATLLQVGETEVIADPALPDGEVTAEEGRTVVNVYDERRKLLRKPPE